MLWNDYHWTHKATTQPLFRVLTTRLSYIIITSFTAFGDFIGYRISFIYYFSFQSAMSGPASFFDPFVDIHEDRRDALPPGFQFDAPSNTELPVLGRGTVAVSSNATDSLLFTIRTDTLGAPDLFLQIGKQDCTMYYIKRQIHGNGETKVVIPTVFLKNKEACYLRPGVKTTYWFSIDNPNGILSYGKYYTNKSLTLLQATLKERSKQGTQIWINQEEYGWLDRLKHVELTQDKGTGVRFESSRTTSR